MPGGVALSSNVSWRGPSAPTASRVVIYVFWYSKLLKNDGSTDGIGCATSVRGVECALLMRLVSESRHDGRIVTEIGGRCFIVVLDRGDAVAVLEGKSKSVAGPSRGSGDLICWASTRLWRARPVRHRPGEWLGRRCMRVQVCASLFYAKVHACIEHTLGADTRMNRCAGFVRPRTLTWTKHARRLWYLKRRLQQIQGKITSLQVSFSLTPPSLTRSILAICLSPAVGPVITAAFADCIS